MKRLVFLVALMALTMGAFSEGQKIYDVGYLGRNVTLENGSYRFPHHSEPDDYIHPHNIAKGADGWCLLDFKGEGSPFDEVERKVYMIPGTYYVGFFDGAIANSGKDSLMTDLWWYTMEYTKRQSSKDFLEKIQNLSETNKGACGCCLKSSPNFSVEKIEASSYYTERTASGQTIEYIPDVLNYTGFYYAHLDYIIHDPWVPGKKKSAAGIGEYLNITFIEPMDRLVVLNGYVDPFKPYLYKANNRVKKALVRSLDPANPFEVEYEFDDYVHFAEIKFPAAASKVQFVIQEVYPGERWNDTCVSGVFSSWIEH